MMYVSCNWFATGVVAGRTSSVIPRLQPLSTVRTMNNNTENNNDSADEASNELADLTADQADDVVGGVGGQFVSIDSLEPIDLESPTRTSYTTRTFSIIRPRTWFSSPDRTF